MRTFLCITTPLLLLLLALTSGCDLGDSLGTTSQLTSAANGGSFVYTLDQSFTLELDVSADAGYSWFYASSDSTIVSLEKTAYRPKSGDWNQCGGMTVETFFFRTTKTGQCTITLVERQGWMPNVPPINAFQIIVMVHR